MRKQVWYTITITKDGINRYIVAYYKYADQRAKELPMMREHYEKKGYKVEEGFGSYVKPKGK